jgi:hypothetical protein
VHLEELRCNGAAHGGCQAECLFFWKGAWLEPADVEGAARAVSNAHDRGGANGAQVSCSEEVLREKTTRLGDTPEELRYVCQATELYRATKPLKYWNPLPYLRDVTSGNFRLGHVLGVLLLGALRVTIRYVKGYRAQIALYNKIAKRLGKPDYASIAMWKGDIPVSTPTPDAPNSFKPGDWVRVRPISEIKATLNVKGQNRGLYFDSDMSPYCGRRLRVRGLVTQIIDEPTGKMMRMKNPCITMDGVICNSEYGDGRLMCPRGTLSYWRPSWLEVAGEPSAHDSDAVKGR